MVRIESIHAQYPTGNCPVSLSKFFSFFSLQQWKGFRKKHLSKNSPHHSSIFITTNRYYFDRGCRSDVDYRSHLRPTTFSLSPIQRGMFFNELPLRDCTSFESSDRKNYTVPMGEPTKAADAKGWAQWGRNIAWKNLDSSRPVERISIDSGIKKGSRITINYTWFEKISSRDEFPIFRDRMGNSPRKFNGRYPINISSILFHKISFVITLLLLNMNRCVLKKKKRKKTFHSYLSLISKSMYESNSMRREIIRMFRFVSFECNFNCQSSPTQQKEKIR